MDGDSITQETKEENWGDLPDARNVFQPIRF